MNSNTSNRWAVSVLVLISGLVFLFLLWLLYLREPVSAGAVPGLGFLPPLNAVFNTLSACCLIAGFMAILKGERKRHMSLMLSALFFSTLFLISYLVYHSLHGDTPFQGEGMIRAFYFFILITHILFSAVMFPLILISLYFAASGKFHLHPKVARFALPLWLYVSVTGVLVYLMLHQMPVPQTLT